MPALANSSLRAMPLLLSLCRRRCKAREDGGPSLQKAAKAASGGKRSGQWVASKRKPLRRPRSTRIPVSVRMSLAPLSQQCAGHRLIGLGGVVAQPSTSREGFAAQGAQDQTERRRRSNPRDGFVKRQVGLSSRNGEPSGSRGGWRCPCADRLPGSCRHRVCFSGRRLRGWNRSAQGRAMSRPVRELAG